MLADHCETCGRILPVLVLCMQSRFGNPHLGRIMGGVASFILECMKCVLENQLLFMDAYFTYCCVYPGSCFVASVLAINPIFAN